MTNPQAVRPDLQAMRPDLDDALHRYREGIRSPYYLFRELDDDDWFFANTEGYRQHSELQAVLPWMPDPAVQERIIGSSGDRALLEAFNAYRLFKRAFEANVGPIEMCRSLLDFGCGWGRMIRFFLKDMPPERLHGVDPNEYLIGLCRETNRWADFSVSNVMPPLTFPDRTFDLIYAYSVFSHLSEETHLRWLEELARVMRPVGVLAVTTWHRGFIEQCADLRARADGSELTVWQKEMITKFIDAERWFSAYDAGAFCYEPYDMPSHQWSYLDGVSYYGEACIPRAYVEAHWSTYFDLVDFIDDRALCPQNMIVVKRNDRRPRSDA